MFCGFCGEELPEGSKFCNACGKSIDLDMLEDGTGLEEDDSEERGDLRPGHYIYINDGFWQQKGGMQAMTAAALFSAALALICVLIYPPSAFFLTTIAVIVSIVAFRREATALTMLAMIFSIVSGILAFLKAVADAASVLDVAALAEAVVSSARSIG